MGTLTVVGFASGSPQSQMAMARIAREHHLAAVVVPRTRGGLRQLARRVLKRPEDPLAQLGAPLIRADEIARFHPDVIVVASFPQILPAATLASARIGALNVHMSLLPRHRGPDPLFWTYWDDDAEAGLTIHWMDENIDAGDIAAQEGVAFERGLASRELYMRLAARGAEMLGGVLNQVAAGQGMRVPQDRARATYQSAGRTARARIPFAQWPAARVWHVLSGLGDQFSGLLASPAGEQLEHGRATGYHITAEVKPGSIGRVDGGYELHCQDGLVAVSGRR